jgi:hypothetical protein
MTDTRLTQAAVEEWITTTPDEQVTQAAVEEWATVAAAVPSTQNISVAILA